MNFVIEEIPIQIAAIWPIVSFSPWQRNWIKTISDWSPDCTDHKNCVNFCMRQSKCAKIWFSKSMFNVKIHMNISFSLFKNINLGAHFLFLPCVTSKLKNFSFIFFLIQKIWYLIRHYLSTHSNHINDPLVRPIVSLTKNPSRNPFKMWFGWVER